MALAYADVLQKVNDLWSGIGDGARLSLNLDGSNVAIVHPHGQSISLSINKHDLNISLNDLATGKLIPALTELKERVQ